jgi:predicted RNA binding protein YcfA (HicA-like mRNA interferase family)
MKRLSGKELARVLEARGWVLRRIQGSHHIYTRSGLSVTLSVPIHGNRTLRVGTQRQLMKLAGLTDDQLNP